MVDFSKRAVHVMVSPELKTTYVVQCLGGMERFRMFIDECLADAGSDLLKTPDNMLFRYVMDAEKFRESIHKTMPIISSACSPSPNRWIYIQRISFRCGKRLIVWRKEFRRYRRIRHTVLSARPWNEKRYKRTNTI